MRIVHVCLSLGTGGAEKLLVDNLPLYKKRGLDVSIIQLSSVLEETSYIKKMDEEGINVLTLSNKGFYGISYILKLIKVFRKEKYDIVHAHLFPVFYYIAIVRLFISSKTKFVFTEHNVKNGRTDKKVFKIIEPFIYKQFNAIVAISENVKTMLLNRLPKLQNRIVLINNGVDLSKMNLAIPYKNEEFKAFFNIKKDSKTLLMTSRFSNPKNQNAIIKALVQLPDNYILLFAGDGPDIKQSKELVAKLNLSERVVFLGFRNDVFRLMKSVDMNILSSKHEGFSGVTLEALASGRPFLGSDVPGIFDIVPNQSFLFKENDHYDLAEKIMYILNDKHIVDEMRKLSLDFIKNHDSNFMVDKHIDLYENL